MTFSANRSIPFAALAALVVAVNVPTSATAAPFGNGGFETPTVSGTYATVTAPGTIGPWVVNGSVNHGKGPAATTCSTASGQCIDLNGNGPGGITQTYDNTCTYRVDFMMSRHTQLTTASLEAFADTISKGVFIHNVAGVTSTDGKWQPHTFNFVGGATTKLAFQSKVMSGAAGPQIDNVTVKLVSCV
jgi:hypothetical protein